MVAELLIFNPVKPCILQVKCFKIDHACYLSDVSCVHRANDGDTLDIGEVLDEIQHDVAQCAGLCHLNNEIARLQTARQSRDLGSLVLGFLVGVRTGGVGSLGSSKQRLEFGSHILVDILSRCQPFLGGCYGIVEDCVGIYGILDLINKVSDTTDDGIGFFLTECSRFG